MFRGKTKKVKKYREEGEAYKGGRNPFQVLISSFLVGVSL